MRAAHRLENRIALSYSHEVTHEHWMALALEQAEKAREAGEVPVGAVVVAADRLIGAGFNRSISAVDPTAHAEIVALREAAAAEGNYRLTGATLYVTTEPCLMCVGAMVHARIGLLVYGSTEPKSGAIVSTVRAHESPGLNHRIDTIGGVLEDECRAMIQAFSRERRNDR
jgi:tRNA(adenine34) deaminase